LKLLLMLLLLLAAAFSATICSFNTNIHNSTL